jgi:hypothetical protein
MAYGTAERARDWGWAAGSPNPDLRDITLQLPWHPRSSSGKTQKVYAHVLIAELFLDAATAAVLASGWVPKRTDSYVERKIRGSTGWSIHSWAIAWDIFRSYSDIPPPGGVWTPTDQMPASFVHEFEKRGFTWGGRWNRRDTPHIEWSGPPPDSSPPGDDDMTPEEKALLEEAVRRLRRIEPQTERSEQALWDGVPKFGQGGVLPVVNQINYSIAGIGEDNLRQFIEGLASGENAPVTITTSDARAIAAAVWAWVQDPT